MSERKELQAKLQSLESVMGRAKLRMREDKQKLEKLTGQVTELEQKVTAKDTGTSR